LPFLVLPCRTRTDPGTENPILAQCQMFLRRDGEDEFGGPNSHYTGSSEINQPIEAFWRIFREGGSQFWIDHFKVVTVKCITHLLVSFQF